jgi:hypothetical protein
MHDHQKPRALFPVARVCVRPIRRRDGSMLSGDEMFDTVHLEQERSLLD